MIHGKQFPWQMAKMRKIAVTNVTLPFVWWEAYWTMWAEVMFNSDRRTKKTSRL